MIIKVCGMTQGDNIRSIEQLGIDMVGFIFYSKSPRCIHELPEYLPQHAQRVGVFVNETKENILMYADRFGLHYLQLHGNESPEYCRSLQAAAPHLQLIKSFPISVAKDLLTTEAYQGVCAYYLFDAKTPQHGGSGNQFDWELLHLYRDTTPFLLSGGINLYSAPALKLFHHSQFAGIDLNSRFEKNPGMKDVERIKQFLQELRTHK